MSPKTQNVVQNKTQGVDVLVIGAGVVGAAVASMFAEQGKSVVVLEKFDRVAEGVTSRNSGVIHSGIYYPPHSLKARCCIRGKELLYEWCEKKGVPHAKTGKVILATNAQEAEQLHFLHENALASGASGIKKMGKAETQQFLSYLSLNIPMEASLFASETGIVDPFAFTASLLASAEENGAMVLTRAEVSRIEHTSSGFNVECSRGNIAAIAVVNAAGLDSDEVARLAGIDKYKIYPCRGDYFKLRTKKKYRHLLYPVKAKGASGLGIHLTLDIEGGVRLGPDTEYVSSKSDFSPREDKRELFRSSAEKLLGPLNPEDLTYDQCGIRPKLRAPHENDEKDFVIGQDVPNFINLVGIESPGLTSAIAIAEHVVKLVVI